MYFSRAEKKVADLQSLQQALTTQNEYQASRVDGQEEDKGALKQEIKKLVLVYVWAFAIYYTV